MEKTGRILYHPSKVGCKVETKFGCYFFNLKGTCGRGRKHWQDLFVLSQQVPVVTYFFVFGLFCCWKTNMESICLRLASPIFTGTIVESGFPGKVCATIWVKSRGNRCIFVSFHLGMGNENHLLTFNQSMTIHEMSHDNYVKDLGCTTYRLKLVLVTDTKSSLPMRSASCHQHSFYFGKASGSTGWTTWNHLTHVSTCFNPRVNIYMGCQFVDKIQQKIEVISLNRKNNGKLSELDRN